jgi:hypothetical protein
MLGLTLKLSDGGHKGHRMQPQRDAAVRCSALLGGLWYMLNPNKLTWMMLLDSGQCTPHNLGGRRAKGIAEYSKTQAARSKLRLLSRTEDVCADPQTRAASASRTDDLLPARTIECNVNHPRRKLSHTARKHK